MILLPASEIFEVFRSLRMRWCIVAYWLALACSVRSHPYAGHPLVPVPFPFAAGSYRHTSSVVNVPVHQERIIIIKKPRNNNQDNGYPHEYRNSRPAYNRYLQRNHKNEHDSFLSVDSRHGFREQESQSPFITDMKPFLSFYQEQRSQRYPYFQDMGYLLDPQFIQQSMWLEQFPDML